MRILKTTMFLVAALSTATAFAAPRGKRVAKTTAQSAAVPAAEARMQEPSRDSEVRRGLRFEAFVDAQAKITNKDEIDDRGFTLNDAALYISKDFGTGLTALVDLPFFGGGATNGFNFASERAQAYFQLQRGALVGKFGQFDTPFGFELNDSRDRFFADAGGIKEWVLPQTHTGVTVGYGMQNLLFRGILANPSNTGTMANLNPEFGAQARLEAGAGYGAVGFLLNEQKNAAAGGNDSKTNMLIDVMGGFKADKFTIDGSFNSKKTAGVDKSGIAFGVLGAYAASNDLAIGGRFEYFKDVVIPAGNGSALAESAFTFTAGPSYKFSDDVTLRGDLSFGNIKPAGGGSSTDLFSVAFSAVANL